MYEKFYGLSAKPFQMVPNPSFLYLSELHGNALTYLEYGLTERVGFVLLTGEVGTGKTTLIQHMLGKLPADTVPALIFNTNVDGDQLIRLILQEFEVEPVASKAGNIDLLQHYLISQFGAGTNPVLIIDEAQNLSDEALEEVRMLFNLQTDEQMLLQVILVGQPELKKRLTSPHLAQLRQRVAASYHLTALSEMETAAYIASRLAKAGGIPALFSEEAVIAVFQASGGIPRTINLICDAALVYGFADEVRQIDAPIIAEVLAQNEGMALTMAETADNSPVSQGLPSETAQPARIAALEARMRDMQQRLDRLLEQRSGPDRGQDDRLAANLGRLLQQERQKCDDLLRDNALLRDHLRILLEDKTNLNEPAAPDEHPAAPAPESPEPRGLAAWFRQAIFCKS